MLRRQLARFVSACELGYDVHVVLVTYSGWNVSTTGVLDPSELFCAAQGRAVPVEVELYPLEALPPHTYGTLGTLAFQHRHVLYRRSNDYDLYVSMEDDVAVHAHHFSYFSKWSAAFSGTPFLPGFVSYELAPWERSELRADHVWLDWRLRNAYRFLAGGQHDAVAMRSSTCCLYMLTAAQLGAAIAEPNWLTVAATATGEFNPRFNSARWLHPFYTIVTPVEDFLRATVHLTTNKYINVMRTQDARFQQLRQMQQGVNGLGESEASELADLEHTLEWSRPLALSEAHAVFSACNRDQLAFPSVLTEMRPQYIVANKNCTLCMGTTAAVRVEVLKSALFTSPSSPLVVTYTCVGYNDVRFPPEERR